MERYKLDVVSKTLTVTEKFAKKLQDPTSEEFTLYTTLMATILILSQPFNSNKNIY